MQADKTSYMYKLKKADYDQQLNKAKKIQKKGWKESIIWNEVSRKRNNAETNSFITLKECQMCWSLQMIYPKSTERWGNCFPRKKIVIDDGIAVFKKNSQQSERIKKTSKSCLKRMVSE